MKDFSHTVDERGGELNFSEFLERAKGGVCVTSCPPALKQL